MDRTKKFLAGILTVVMLTVGCTNTIDKKSNEVSDAETTSQQSVSEAVTEIPAQETTKEETNKEETNKDNEDVDAVATNTVDEASVENTGTHKTSWIDGALKENLQENMDISLKDDFYLYVNYDWLKNTEIPEGYSSWNSFSEAAKMTRERELSVIMDESLEGHDAELVRDLYNAYLDWDERNKTGLEPLAAKIQQINEIETVDDLTEILCDHENGRYLPKFVRARVEPGVADSSKYIVTLRVIGHFGAIGKTTSYTDRQYTAEKTLIADMMERLGYSRIDAAQTFEAAMMRVNAIIYSYLAGKDYAVADFFPSNTVIMTKEELGKLTSDFPLLQLLETQGFGDAEEYQVVCPESFGALDTIYKDTNLQNLKKYMISECVLNMSQFLDRETSDYIMNYKRLLYGIEGDVSDEERALSTIESYLEIPLTHIYLQKYDSSELKGRIIKLIENIISEYRKMLTEEEWISEGTKKNAIEKLDKIKINVMYSDKWDDGFIDYEKSEDNYENDYIEWDDYSNLDLNGLSFLQAMGKIEDYNKEKNLSNSGREVDVNEWKWNTLATNAFYDIQDNSINICLGIVDGMFYNENLSDEELYACLGTVIGHEISHAFDTQGALFDKNGDYKDWWDHEDYVTLQKKADKLIAYLEKLTKNLNWRINGQAICGEAIADMAGMKVILRLAGKEETFDYNKFFISYAKLWRKTSTYEAELYQNQADSHPLNYIRANTVLQQYDEFLNTFDIKEGDGMYLEPKDRVCIW